MNEFIVSNECLTCPHKFEWGEPIIIKVPEGACFCIKCAEKYPDQKKYDGELNGFLVHEFSGQEKFEYIKN